jgi:predicted unusual protein kinase regulating ubiquinone biosynthesis (AarF/ABC1/UbiB family)
LNDDSSKNKPVPRRRAARLSRMVQLATGVAGGMLAEGGRQLTQGKRPKAKDLLLTPANARRVTDQLAHLRGAAMKVGQMLSMDTGDMLPKELTDILARLRSDAQAMPAAQLEQVLIDAYGEDWHDALYSFEYTPLAAASIGQVHKAVSQKGEHIVLKIQYPGVRESIDSDIDNVATLLRISGLLPDGIDIQPLLEVAKEQLRDEADYLKEADYLQRYGALLADDERFLLPRVDEELTTPEILAMTYVPGVPIETLAKQGQKERDRIMSLLLELFFRELFEFRLVQTDPNFANYAYDTTTRQLVLLDFGATQAFDEDFAEGYRDLLAAALAEDRQQIQQAAEAIGYALGEDETYRDLVFELFQMATEPLCYKGAYDFGRSDLAARLNETGMAMQEQRDHWQAPPPQAMYLHRKLGGLFMLATRLKSRVKIRQLLEAHLS